MGRVERFIASPLGALVARPWFDRFTLKFLERWFFPLSRLWAAARAADSNPERFFLEVPMEQSPRSHRLMATLMRFDRARTAAAAAEESWERAFFGQQAKAPASRLAAIETRRLKMRAAYNEARRYFAFLRHRGVPPVRWEISPPVQVAQEYARVMREPVAFFSPPEVSPAVAVSKRIPFAQRTDYWIRFRSPSSQMNDDVVARVHEPEGISNPPTLVFLHGICVEFDHWHGMIDEVAELCRMGIRVVRPEAPWHGRRVPAGRYGGEKFIGSLPIGSLAFFSAQVREVSVLLDWSRRTSSGPVALGGSSLGAHVARAAAAWARDWPCDLQPDALLLITPCGRLEDAAIEGAFASVWGTTEAALSRGWAPELRSKWFSLIDPPGTPVVDSRRIVAVLGNRDRITPYDSGKRLIAELGLPAENVFTSRHGHFSIPLSLVRDKAPLQQFHKLLSDAQCRRQ